MINNKYLEFEDKTIKLTDALFTKDILDRTTYFQIAAAGAMGEGGGIVFLTEDGTVYHSNYCRGDLKWETVQQAFPVIGKCRFGHFGFGAKVPEGWAYVHLGMGNHLLVRQDRYPEFAPLAAKCKSPAEIYQNWLEYALLIQCKK